MPRLSAPPVVWPHPDPDRFVRVVPEPMTHSVPGWTRQLAARSQPMCSDLGTAGCVTSPSGEACLSSSLVERCEVAEVDPWRELRCKHAVDYLSLGSWLAGATGCRQPSAAGMPVRFGR